MGFSRDENLEKYSLKFVGHPAGRTMATLIARIARKCKHCGEYRDSSVKVVDPGAGMLLSFAL